MKVEVVRLKKKTISLVVSVLVILLIVTACGNNGNNGNGALESPSPGDSSSSANPEPTPTPLEPVNLTWYYPTWSQQADLAQVQDAVNKITKEKLNATITLNAIDFGNYQDKMNTIVAAGDKFDIAWTSNWSFFYGGAAKKGAFLELTDELLDTYAPELKSSMSSAIWDDVRISDGKIYGVPNNQSMIIRAGFLVQKEIADKYGLDPASIKAFKDIEPFLAAVKAGEPDKIPLVMSKSGGYRGQIGAMVENMGGGVGIRVDGSDLKVVDIFEMQEFKDFLPLVRSWYTKGYINEDAATLKNQNDILSTGNGVAFMHNVLKPGGEIEFKSIFGGKDVISVPIADSFIPIGKAQATMNAISRTSQNPERALMFLNLINTDKELFNLMAYGIEGEHYTKIGDNTIRVIPDGGYKVDASWMYGSDFNSFVLEGKPSDIWEITKKDNDTAKKSPIMGFSFNSEPVKAEIANLGAVNGEFEGILSTGSVDPDKYYPRLLEQRKAAGVDRVIQEVQKQLDAWKVAMGK